MSEVRSVIHVETCTVYSSSVLFDDAVIGAVIDSALAMRYKLYFSHALLDIVQCTVKCIITLTD